MPPADIQFTQRAVCFDQARIRSQAWELYA
jgi:hypothetical protein